METHIPLYLLLIRIFIMAFSFNILSSYDEISSSTFNIIVLILLAEWNVIFDATVRVPLSPEVFRRTQPQF